MKKSLYIPACASLALVMGLSYADSASASETSELSPPTFKTKVKKFVGLNTETSGITKLTQDKEFDKSDVQSK